MTTDFSGLKNTSFLCYNYVEQKSHEDILGLTLRCWQGCLPFGDNLCPRLFQLPAFLDCWPLASSEPGMAVESFSRCITVTFSSASLFHFTSLCDDTGSTHIIQNSLPILRAVD